MLTLQKPTPQMIQKFLQGQRSQEWNYPDVGATNGHPPEGFVLDHTRVKIGEGEQAFVAGKATLERWQQFQVGWTEIQPADAPIREGELVAVVARVLKVWWTNPARLVYVIEESQSEQPRFGFAYGTLPGHVGKGEERFLVEMDDTGSVWYDILAFSRPGNLLARIGYPYMRRVQKQFGKQSAAVMKQAIARELQTVSPS